MTAVGSWVMILCCRCGDCWGNVAKNGIFRVLWVFLECCCIFVNDRIVVLISQCLFVWVSVMGGYY